MKRLHYLCIENLDPKKGEILRKQHTPKTIKTAYLEQNES